MQDKIVATLYNSLSPERLNAYRDRGDLSSETSVLNTYLWNLELSKSLYPTLHAVEISLRNHIHTALTDEYDDRWFDNRKLLHNIREINRINKAKSDLIKNSKEITPGKIIAELNFGFWTSLFDARYEQILWPKLLKPIFPYIPKRLRTRAVISKRLNRIRRIRNRIFHYEPIWFWVELETYYIEIMETLDWLQPDIKHFIVELDDFDKIYKKGIIQ